MDVERVASHPCFNLCSLGSSCASKPACLGKHNGFSRRSGQTYPLVADRADLRPSTSLLLCFFGFACVARDES